MSEKKDLGQLFEEILNDDANKADVTVAANQLRMDEFGRVTSLDLLESARTLNLSDWALTQATGKLNIPTRYFKSCPPQLQAENFNHWASRADGEWLLRSRDVGNAMYVRGVLSAERYTRFDNAQLVEILQKMFGATSRDYELVLTHLDDGGFHARLVFHDLTAEIGSLRDGRPDVHKVGLHISNSEVGRRSVLIAPMVYRLVCTNGLMRWEADGDALQMRHVHLRPEELYNRVAEGAAKALRVGDKMLNELRLAKEVPVENPLDVVRELAKERQYSQAFTDNLVMAYAANAAETGHNVFSVVQAMTQMAQSFPPDDRIEIERDAASVMKAWVAA